MDSCRLYLEHDDAIATGQFANCEPRGERRKTQAVQLSQLKTISRMLYCSRQIIVNVNQAEHV